MERSLTRNWRAARLEGFDQTAIRVLLSQSLVPNLPDMAERRPRVPTSIKNALLDESGGACSNPGCANTVLELHHIREWAVYHSHDEKHMIALCPTCHASVTRGELELTDDTLYAWKETRPDRWAAITMPPHTLHKMLVGSISVTSDHPFAVFDFDSGQSLSFHLDEDGLVLTLNIGIHDQAGNSLLSMRRNTVSHIADHVELEQQPGRVRAVVEDWQPLLPVWAYTQLWRLHPSAVIGGLPLFDIEVLRRGVVRVSGIWASRRAAVVITSNALNFHTNPEAEYPISIEGAGESTVLNVNGPGVLFGIAHERIR